VRERKVLMTATGSAAATDSTAAWSSRAVPSSTARDGSAVVGAHTDVTDRVGGGGQLAQAQKLRRSARSRAVHEVNNQLMAVLGFGEFVEEFGTSTTRPGMSRR
jgi:hypothetical protein